MQTPRGLTTFIAQIRWEDLERDLAFFTENSRAGAALVLVNLLPRFFVGTDELVAGIFLILWPVYYWRQAALNDSAMLPIGYALAGVLIFLGRSPSTGSSN